MIKRREFITLVGGAAAWPMVALAQQANRSPLTGALMNISEDNASATAFMGAFRQELEHLGWSATFGALRRRRTR